MYYEIKMKVMGALRKRASIEGDLRSLCIKTISSLGECEREREREERKGKALYRRSTTKL